MLFFNIEVFNKTQWKLVWFKNWSKTSYSNHKFEYSDWKTGCSFFLLFFWLNVVLFKNDNPQHIWALTRKCSNLFHRTGFHCTWTEHSIHNIAHFSYSFHLTKMFELRRLFCSEMRTNNKIPCYPFWFLLHMQNISKKCHNFKHW